ncbi:MAG: hypothetical protein J6S67_19905 [Methanobrevibacter sp.]|nr:hypothetical protein [Methanobrevibacter sp.]
MDRQAYRDEIKFVLTGGVIDLELDDSALDKVINSAFREVQRYITSTKIITVPFKKCIDLTGCGVEAVTAVFRTEGYTSDTSEGTYPVDPMLASQWQLLSGVGNLYNFQDYVLNYASWNTILQIRNTTSTDLAFRWDRSSNKLYINIATSAPAYITIEFIPRYNDVSEVVSDYWIDVIMKLSVALTKVILGRIRGRYTQTNALWLQDAQTMLEEGNAELRELREHLLNNAMLPYPID